MDDIGSATLFLCGDVMTGRGIDQILAHPSDPQIYESYVKNAEEYVALAEAANGPVPRRVRDPYIWGDALAELAHVAPRALVANLETSVTLSRDYWHGKGIHYRMHPDNVGCLTAARIDVCALANNHVLDFGFTGLHETLDALAHAGIKTAGAGADLDDAQLPAIVPVLAGSRLIVVSMADASSGVPSAWAADRARAGIDLLPDLSDRTAASIVERIGHMKGRQDLAMVSIHWGGNWGFEVPAAHRRFAHRLIDGGIDLIHGHSSHHPRPIELYRGRLILYGCGDFLTDYEGITGYEQYRGDLALMYFPTISTASGELETLRLTPMHIKAFRLARASFGDARWIRDTLTRASAPFGTRIQLARDGTLTLDSR